ncbi:hypothetical protein HMPREF1500_0477 [Fusobacterium sp. CM22]|nr:hypothetical protein HMPREF1500_0477 [Fusobacterium sp. CM22]
MFGFQCLMSMLSFYHSFLYFYYLTTFTYILLYHTIYFL